MNRAKVSIFNKLRKKMTKAIKYSRSFFLSDATKKYEDEETEKELFKKHPKRKTPQPHINKAVKAKTKEARRDRIEKLLAEKTAHSATGPSKRTTPGTVFAESSPAAAHKEGARWIKNLSKQTQAQRAIQTHNTGKK